MKKNLTELVFILDRSGSMSGLERDTIGGFNAMIEKQKKQDGECIVSTVLFNNDSQVIHDRVPLDKIEPNLTEGKKIEFVNIRDNGELITTNICEYTSEVIRSELGIKNFTMHSLRHTNATKLIENGVSPKAVQIRLGHKNIEETMHIYPHCSGKMEYNAVEIANSIF